MTDLDRLAARVDDAARHAEAIAQLTTGAVFSLDEAYVIQRASIERRIDRGETMAGVKLGFTSRAKMIQMGVDSLIWGWLTDTMLEEDGGHVALDRFIHPRVEPEVCFLTRRDIDRPLTLLEAAGYLEAVAPAMEIIDSRYRDFRFTLEDVVADNCSSAGLTIGAASEEPRSWPVIAHNKLPTVHTEASSTLPAPRSSNACCRCACTEMGQPGSWSVGG
jgi:2-oxo-3-hexenedioate decarboxylase